jgi:hypothetical protein
MPLKSFKIFCVAVSLLIFSACNDGPEVTICMVYGKGGVLNCRDPKGKVFALTPVQANNFTCFSPQDLQTILNYLKSKGK